MRSNLDHFMKAVARAAKKPAHHAVQSKPVRQAQMLSANVVSTTKATTTELSDEQYRTSIITLALAHIKKKWSNA